MIEIFKEVTIGGLDYKISNFGNIIGEKGKIKQRLNKDGYLVVTLGSSKNNTRTSYFVHKLVALYFVNNDDTDKKVEVNHKDCNRANPRYDNLEWISHIDNIRYSSNKGHYKSSKEGLKNGRCTYTKEQVIKIRELYKIGYSIMDIIKQIFPDYDYKQRKLKWNTVKDICTYKSFKNI